MAKQKTAQTRAEKTHEEKTKSQDFVEPELVELDNAIVAIEMGVTKLEDALACLEVARVEMVASQGSVSRIVTAKQHITEVLKILNPYLNG